MRGWTDYEKQLFSECGYHNYSEFSDDIENLIAERYGNNHGILIRKEPCKTTRTRYKRSLDDHIFTFDVSNCCEKAKEIEKMMQAKVFSIKGRDMFAMWQATEDIEECIIFSDGSVNIISV